jgi:hypothetical protein
VLNRRVVGLFLPALFCCFGGFGVRVLRTEDSVAVGEQFGERGRRRCWVSGLPLPSGQVSTAGEGVRVGGSEDSEAIGKHLGGRGARAGRVSRLTPSVGEVFASPEGVRIIGSEDSEAVDSQFGERGYRADGVSDQPADSNPVVPAGTAVGCRTQGLADDGRAGWRPVPDGMRRWLTSTPWDAAAVLRRDGDSPQDGQIVLFEVGAQHAERHQADRAIFGSRRYTSPYT